MADLIMEYFEQYSLDINLIVKNALLKMIDHSKHTNRDFSQSLIVRLNLLQILEK